MSAEIKNLSPQPVWGYFYDLTQIPRPTGHMEAVTRFMVAFGKGLGLETLQDEVGNVLIRKPASPKSIDQDFTLTPLLDAFKSSEKISSLLFPSLISKVDMIISFFAYRLHMYKWHNHSNNDI